MENMERFFQKMLLAERPHSFSRDELLENHERTQNSLRQKHENMSADQDLYRISHTSASHVPHSSKASLSSLKRITLSELSINTIHHGRVLVCRTIVKPFKVVSVQAVIEDPIVGQSSPGMQVAVTRMSLYNFVNFTGPHYDVSNILPVGTRLYIKEPHYKLGSQDGVPMIRCDSPSDVILVPNEQVDGSLLAGLRWSDALPIKYGPNINRGLRSQSESADNLKKRGNEQFARKDYASAINSYTHALELDPNNVVLLSNRAQAYLHLDQFRQAVKDAEAVVKIDGTNMKALYRQAKALYGMRSYKEVLEVFKKLKTKDAETKGLYHRTQQRLEEQQHGRYDILDILREAQSIQPPYLDHADYVGPVRLTEIPGKGRGMVATEEIVEGTLLLCSKAFAIVFNRELPANTVQISINLSKQQSASMSQSHVITKIAQKLQREPWTANELYSLYAGPDIPRMSNDRTDTPEGVQIDIDRITNIVAVNAFAPISYDDGPWSDISTSKASEAKTLHDFDKTKGTGIWILPSFFNHSCLANASYLNLGDLMFVRAVRGIAEGEEICLPYMSPCELYDEREKKLEKRKFKCHCSLCEFERAQPEATRHRGRLLEEFLGMRDAITKNDPTMMPRLISIIDELRKTYQTAGTATATNVSTSTSNNTSINATNTNANTNTNTNSSTGASVTTSAKKSTHSRRGKKGKNKKVISPSVSVSVNASASASANPSVNPSVNTRATATSVLLPHQLQFGMFHPLSALFYLQHCSGQPRQAAQTLIEAFEMLPQYGGIVNIRAVAAISIKKTYEIMNMSEQIIWLELARKNYELIFGFSENWQDFIGY